jgi:hypothetical protein
MFVRAYIQRMNAEAILGFSNRSSTKTFVVRASSDARTYDWQRCSAQIEVPPATTRILGGVPPMRPGANALSYVSIHLPGSESILAIYKLLDDEPGVRLESGHPGSPGASLLSWGTSRLCDTALPWSCVHWFVLVDCTAAESYLGGSCSRLLSWAHSGCDWAGEEDF